MSDDKVMQRIRQLLAQAESTTHPAEAELCTERAEKLMMQHGIDQVMLQRAAGEEIVNRKLTYTGRYAQAQVILGDQVCRALGGLRTYRHVAQGRGTRPQDLHIVGFEGDVDRAITLVTSLQTQCLAALEAWNREQADSWEWSCRTTDHQKFVERRGFVIAFGQGAGDRIKANRLQVVREAEVTRPGTEVALRNRDLEVNRWLSARVRLGRARGVTMGARGRESGYREGQRARTGERQVGGSRALAGR